MAKKIVVKEPVTYEEFLAKEYTYFCGSHGLNEDNIPDANYHYKVGEKVRVGNLKDCRVEEVLMNGKLIHISRHDCGETYGKPYDNQRRLPILRWWVDVEPIDTITDTNFSRDFSRYSTNYVNNSLESLIFKIYSRGLMTSPDYQRDYVWTLEDKQRLIQSIFDHSDIGKFIFLEREYPENRLEVIDGKQRLNAIQEFYEGRFEFKGKTYFQLSNADKHTFNEIMVQVSTMDAKRVKKSDVLWLFLSVNAGGVPQTEAHIAKARKMYELELEKENV